MNIKWDTLAVLAGWLACLGGPLPAQAGMNEQTDWVTPPAESSLFATPSMMAWDELDRQAEASAGEEALAVFMENGDVRLRCTFQKLEGRAGEDGLWLHSTAADQEGECFQIKAWQIGREGGEMRALAESGQVSADGSLACYVRPGLSEEYSVSMDGVRQDFLIGQRPGGDGALLVALAVEGALVEMTTNGVRLLLPTSGRRLAYSRLHVEDASGRKLEARFEVESSALFRVRVQDEGAVYPLRIDPTVSDDNWSSMSGAYRGTNGKIYAFTTDQTGNLYVGGYFSVAGDRMARNIAKWDGQQWAAMGEGLAFDVMVLAMVNDQLYAGGLSSIARWDGNRWSGLGSGVSGLVHAMAWYNGELYVAGPSTAGGVPVNGIAKWDGSRWSPVGSGTDGTPNSLALFKGELHMGGYFSLAGGVTANQIAKWNGSRWASLGSGLAGGDVKSLTVMNDKLYVAGRFNSAGSTTAKGIAAWNGSQWAALAGPVLSSGEVNSLTSLNGELYVAGYGITFSTAAQRPVNIAKWNGSSWFSLEANLGPGTNDRIYTLMTLSGGVYAGGDFTEAAGVSVNYIARWSGSQWLSLTTAQRLETNGVVRALMPWNNELYAAGDFTMIGGVEANRIAKWDGQQWSALGHGVSWTGSGQIASVRALTMMNGELYAGGWFRDAGGALVNNISRWNGKQWFPLQSGLNGEVTSLAVFNNQLVAAGYFSNAGSVIAYRVAKWDGQRWSDYNFHRFMDASFYGANALAVFHGDLYVGGNFYSGGDKCIQKWDGNSWDFVDNGIIVGSVSSMHVFNDYLIVSGISSNWWINDPDIKYSGKWDGKQWSSWRSGLEGAPSSLVELNGEFYAGGHSFANKFNNIAKWNGQQWATVGAGIPDGGDVYALASFRGDLYVGGRFHVAGNKYSPNLARFTPDATTTEALNLAITTERRPQGGVRTVLRFTVEQGYNYTIEASSDLTTTAGWQALLGAPHQTGTVTDESTALRKFYRLCRTPNP